MEGNHNLDDNQCLGTERRAEMFYDLYEVIRDFAGDRISYQMFREMGLSDKDMAAVENTIRERRHEYAQEMYS